MADGHLIIAVGNDRQFAGLCDVLGLDGFAADPRYATNPARLSKRDELVAAISARTCGFQRDDLLLHLERAGVPGGPINTIAEAFADPQIRHRGLQIAPEGRPGVRSPIRFSDAVLNLTRGAPGLSADRDAILAELEALENPGVCVFEG